MKNLLFVKKLIKFSLSAFVLLGGLTSSVLANSGIQAGDSWVRATPPGAANSAAYIIVHNHGSEDDYLIGVHSDIAEVAELHNVVQKGAMMSMEPVENIKVPAGGFIELKPKSYHIMLIHLKETPKVGEHTSLTLKFKNAGEMKVMAPILESQQSGHDHKTHDHGGGKMKKKTTNHTQKHSN